MYRWRKMTPAQREETLRQRKLNERPAHSPKHTKTGSGVYLITATCYEHKPVIGFSDARVDQFSAELLKLLAFHSKQIDAWVVLPNHYHAVVGTTRCADLLHALGRLHGRTSFQWKW
jgi:putative transposase